MARGRKPSGRSAALNSGRVTRTASRTLAAQSPGAGHWRQEHERKKVQLFCEALRAERTLHLRNEANGVPIRGLRHEPYACRYGSHWLIETAPLHWHFGRPPGRTR